MALNRTPNFHCAILNRHRGEPPPAYGVIRGRYDPDPKLTPVCRSCLDLADQGVELYDANILLRPGFQRRPDLDQPPAHHHHRDSIDDLIDHSTVTD